MTTRAKKEKPVGNKNKKVTRDFFESTPQKSARVKSKTATTTSSTKVGKGNFLSRMTTIVRRIAGRG